MAVTCVGDSCRVVVADSSELEVLSEVLLVLASLKVLLGVLHCTLNS